MASNLFQAAVVQPTLSANEKYGGFSWYQEFQQISRDPNQMRAAWDRWRMSAGWDSQAESIVSGAISWEESRSGKRDLFGVIPVSAKDYETLGEVGATVGTVGLVAGAVYAGGLSTGLIGTGEAVASGTAAAETAAVSGGAASAVSSGTAASAASATTSGGFLSGITATGINSGLGLINTATNLLRRVGINIGGSNTESRQSAASGGTGSNLDSLYPYYLEGTGPSIGADFGYGTPDQGDTIRDFVRAATGGGIWLIVAAVLLIGGYFLLKRR